MPGLALVLPFLYTLMTICGLGDGNFYDNSVASSAYTAASALIGASYSVSSHENTSCVAAIDVSAFHNFDKYYCRSCVLVVLYRSLSPRDFVHNLLLDSTEDLH